MSLFNKVIKVKENDYCYKHKTTFDSECHQLPSGKTIWIGCPICKKQNEQERIQRDFIKLNQEVGMVYNSDTKEWYKPQPQDEITQTKKRKY